MAAKGKQFPWRWDGCTISANLEVIWEMSAQTRNGLMGIGPLIVAMSIAEALVGFHLRLDLAESPLGPAKPGP